MRSLSILLVTVLSVPSSLWAENALPHPTSEVPPRPLVDLCKAGAEKLAVGTPAAQVTVATSDKGGLDVAIAAGPAAYPGLNFVPELGFDLTGTGFIEASVTNTGTNIISVVVRADQGSNTCSGTAYLKPGESGKARAFFASPGKASGPVDPARIEKILVFIGKNESAPRSFRLEALSASGRPGEKAPVKLSTIRTKPKNGVIFGADVAFDATKQLVARGGAKAGRNGSAIEIAFAGKGDENVLVRPIHGYWDLGEYLEVTVRAKNVGQVPASLSAQLTSQANSSEAVTCENPIAPGETAELRVSFIPKTPFKVISDPAQNVLEGKRSWGVEETPGARYFSHQTTGLLLSQAGELASAFEILSVTAGMPDGDPRPEWLGQRPPAEGEWVKTFEDNFDGSALNTNVWNVHSENYWDKRVGFSRDNVLLGGGHARLRLEKRDGYHNDDPQARATEFATGWLDSYGKWNQAYGYYEVRVKLPAAPSMFPAFWLMPDRGPADWPKSRRTDTKEGGMEFDIFEGQSMWGPYRTTFGTHWDSYVKYHKSAGTSSHYNRPDKEGFLTIGLLWLPGHVSVYSQGRMQGSWDSPRVGSVPSYLIFDLLPGGFEYDPLDPATLPADLVIDYVRVWQRKDLLAAAKK